jgi:hypothetical protein
MPGSSCRVWSPTGSAHHGPVGRTGAGGVPPGPGPGPCADGCGGLPRRRGHLSESDIEATTSQVEIFGPEGEASDSTLLRILDEVAGRLNDDELPARRLAKVLAAARARAWGHIVARHGQLPAVKVAGGDLMRAGVGVSMAGRSWWSAWTLP